MSFRGTGVAARGQICFNNGLGVGFQQVIAKNIELNSRGSDESTNKAGRLTWLALDIA